tara:strand:+ start:6549 stop:6998 length:450 start_codon:yes stop_codon:yes gene_type:complete
MTKGMKCTFIIISINLLIAGIICIVMFGAKSLIDFFYYLPLNLGIGIIGLYFSGYFVAKKMEVLLNKNSKNAILIGVLGLIVILIMGTFFGSTVGFLQEGIVNLNENNKFKDAIFDYYFKPFFWIFFFGIIPTILAGGILGILLKKNKL